MVEDRTANFNATNSCPDRGLPDNFCEFDQVNVDANIGSLTRVTARTYNSSAGAAKAIYDGWTGSPPPDTPGVMRGIFNTDWVATNQVWYGAAIYLQNGFKSSMQEQVDLIRWDTFPPDANGWLYRSGIVIYHSDHKARLIRQKFNVNDGSSVQAELLPSDTGPFSLSEDEWHWIEVHQKLDGENGDAFNEVWLDGASKGSGTRYNMFAPSLPVTRIRYGIVAVGINSQSNPLTLWFDRCKVATGYIGPA